MAQDPLHVLWIEPGFPGRLGGVADWLTRLRGYRSWFYCHTTGPRSHWPGSVGRGLEVQTFGVGGAARDPAVAWTRTLERGLCYAYGCWEVLDKRRPRPIDLIVGRSAGLGSSLFAPVYWPAAPVVSYLDYYFAPHQHDLADEAGPDTPPSYYSWRRSMGAIDLLDLEQASLGWTSTAWQRGLYPAEYQPDIEVFHDGIDTSLFMESSWRARGTGPRVIGGRAIAPGTRVVSFVARTLDRLRGFDRFFALACKLLAARPDVICVAAGDPIVRRGLDVLFHNRDYFAHLKATQPAVDLDRLWMLGSVAPATVAEVLAASDLHVAPGRSYPVARSLLEAMASGCVVLASDTPPHRDLLTPGRDSLLVDGRDQDALYEAAVKVLADRATYRPLGEAAAAVVNEHYSRAVRMPKLAERFTRLVEAHEARR